MKYILKKVKYYNYPREVCKQCIYKEKGEHCPRNNMNLLVCDKFTNDMSFVYIITGSLKDTLKKL
jgi:hypothetical protein